MQTDDDDRETGWYWVTGLGDEPEVARWDRAGQAWNVVGGFEGVDEGGVQVISDRLEPPSYWRTT